MITERIERRLIMSNDIFCLRKRLAAFLETPRGGGVTYSKIILFGAGNTFRLYKKSIESEEFDYECLWDNNAEKRTQEAGITEKPIYKPETYMAEHSVDDGLLVLIVSISKARYEIQAQLDSMGIRNMTIDAFLFQKHRTEILRIFDELCDDLSKRTFAHIILARAGEEDCFPLEIYHPDPYYGVPSFFCAKKNEVVIDLGAFVGDTLETFIHKAGGNFKKVYLFEPNERNAAALTARAERLRREWAIDHTKIEIVHAGIGNEHSTLYIDTESDGSPSSTKILGLQDGNKKAVQVYSLDEFLRDKHEVVTYIKADIESFEYDMLCGAKETIQKYRPRLAICIYHCASDLYKIPALLREYCPDYKFDIRHHSMTLSETVLYAYTDDASHWVDLRQ